MKILKQPRGFDFEQPLLNRVLRVHASLTHEVEAVSGSYRKWFDYYDAETRCLLPNNNWRVKIIRKIGK